MIPKRNDAPPASSQLALASLRLLESERAVLGDPDGVMADRFTGASARRFAIRRVRSRAAIGRATSPRERCLA
jgi:hypothetical protein